MVEFIVKGEGMMSKASVKPLWILLAATCLSSCEVAEKPTVNANENDGQLAAAANPNPDRCTEGEGIHVGDRNVVLHLTGTRFSWDPSGTILALKERGEAKEIELVPSLYIGGPSLPVGDCLRSGGYIRLAADDRTDANRYLQAFQQANPVNVVIGNFPDPQVDSIFNIVKDPEATNNSAGAIIRRGDVVHIRGVSRDPWLAAPDNPTDGSAVGLVNWDQFDKAAPWTITRRGPATQGS